MTQIYFAGVEGGGSGSRACLLRRTGECTAEEVAAVEGDSSNHYNIGMEATAKVIVDMLEECRGVAGLGKPINSVGLALAGCESPTDAANIISAIQKISRSLAVHYEATSDAVGTIKSCQPDGGESHVPLGHHRVGVIMICGTGSAARLLNPDGGVFGCGGHAHMIGDGGSATYIALTAVRTVFDHVDGLTESAHSIDYVRQAMMTYFNVTAMTGMYRHLYTEFDKAFFAKFAMCIVDGAVAGDALCKHIFHENGRIVGRHIAAVSRHAHETLLASPSGLTVVCVGSVWNSWALMRDGFIEGVSTSDRLRKVKLVRTTSSPANGMAWSTAVSEGIIQREAGGEHDNVIETIDVNKL